MTTRFLSLGLALALCAPALTPAVSAQSDRSLYNQDRLAELLYSIRTDLDAVPTVGYRYHTLSHESGNSILARHALYTEMGGGNAREGRERLNGMVAFLNGVYISDLDIGDTIVLPSDIEVDPRAFSPFPRQYAGGAEFDKLFVIDKGVQAWAAYESGQLARWGLVSTGADGSETPAGRFNFNWKEVHRVSTLSPPGESWDMRWVFNFHDRRGIHIHQYYALPTTGPASHGCVRLMTADAQWIYEWADGWVTSNGTASDGLPSRGRITKQGTTVIVTGTEPDGTPQRFRDADGTPQMIGVELPDDVWSVPPGTEQQRAFDRKRRQAANAS